MNVARAFVAAVLGVAGLAWRIVQGVAQKMHVAALPGRLRQHLLDRFPQAGMIIAHPPPARCARARRAGSVSPWL